jgi:hypothetical protein
MEAQQMKWGRANTGVGVLLLAAVTLVAGCGASSPLAPRDTREDGTASYEPPTVPPPLEQNPELPEIGTPLPDPAPERPSGANIGD